MGTATKKIGRKAGAVHGFKDLSTIEGAGTYEAIVAVFSNVDHQGDRIIPGAFAASLEAWKSSGDPIPVIFSHQWDELDSHLGVTLEAEELMPGDERLPVEIRSLGGLWTKNRLDIDEARSAAGRVFGLMQRRSLREFSFAYEVLDQRRTDDGVYELLELGIIEQGPTLKGANPLTHLMSRKSLELVADDFLETVKGLDPELASRLQAIDAKRVVHAFTASTDDPSRCSLCGMSRNTLGHQLLASAEGDGSKAWVDLTGSAEELRNAAYDAVVEQAVAEDLGNGGFYTAYLEATYADRVVALIEGWSDPYGEGIYYEWDMTVDGTTATLSNGREVEIVGNVTTQPKLGGAEIKAALKAQRGKSTTKPKADDTLPPAADRGEPEATGQGGNVEPGGNGSTERSESTGEVARTLLALDTFEL